MRLKSVAQEKPHVLEKSIVLFAELYGLLGVFQSIYLPEPALPKGKLLLAPEAVLGRSGRLKRVNPATEGVDLLVEAQEKFELYGEFLNGVPREAWPRLVTQPEEAQFIVPGKPGQSGKVIPWQKVRQEFGALFVLTEAGVSLVCTREPLLYWEVHLENFPTPEELLSAQHIRLPGVESVFCSGRGRLSTPGLDVRFPAIRYTADGMPGSQRRKHHSKVRESRMPRLFPSRTV